MTPLERLKRMNMYRPRDEGKLSECTRVKRELTTCGPSSSEASYSWLYSWLSKLTPVGASSPLTTKIGKMNPSRRGFLLGGVAALATPLIPHPPSQFAAGPEYVWELARLSMNRQIEPNLIAADICGVQPMTEPVGEIFKPSTWKQR